MKIVISLLCRRIEFVQATVFQAIDDTGAIVALFKSHWETAAGTQHKGWLNFCPSLRLSAHSYCLPIMS